ncbi:MAG TPA: peptidoglycan DD-metalloendopeptidase family protein [Arenimonas sp.]|uniref:peptidoglycan DD-metalloendopeptidase family protein n=1 Tax=Arenimonas sp. TaxID=1872635 RepID=UPI002D7E4238|nr:peptidoglycan DD-metalloendopeptidase family protein [Arenimonas sp.]HEU0153375.1 peptidoglycan DD-metalloendopeptidase family protein [Arenimonas sp.]
MKTTAARALVLLSAALWLAACGHSRVVKREGPAKAPTAQRTVQAAPRDGQYRVRAGDTLYGIAFRHGLDYREVAGWNRIPAPYTIYPGQVLRLAPAGRRPTPGGTVTGMPAPRTTPRDTGFQTVSTPDRPATPAPANPPVKPPVAVPPTPVAAGTVQGTPVVVPSAPIVPAVVSADGWRWPTRGQLIGRFAAGDPKRQGIDIAGTAGQPVLAAADGVVVYSGAGLVGYGELIIVKHSDEWLSAYAHNRLRLVGEGTAVTAGQPIAELGRSGTSRDMLHFEIRRNGKPVDPLTILPPL